MSRPLGNSMQLRADFASSPARTPAKHDALASMISMHDPNPLCPRNHHFGVPFSTLHPMRAHASSPVQTAAILRRLKTSSQTQYHRLLLSALQDHPFSDYHRRHQCLEQVSCVEM